MWELDYKENWAPKNWCFWTVLLEKSFESPLDCKEIKPVNLKGNQSQIFIGMNDAEAETPVLWPPDAKNWLLGKDPDWRQKEKGMTEDEMVGWHHWLNGHEFEQALGVGDGQGKRSVLHSMGSQSWVTELNWTELRLQQHVNQKIPDDQEEFRKGRGTRDQIANIRGIIEKAREFQKNIYFCLIDYTKAFDYVDHNKLWKILKRWEYQITLPASWEICMQVKKQQLELDMKQQTGSKSGKKYVKAVYCLPAYLTYMQSTSWEMLGWMKHKPESRLPG